MKLAYDVYLPSGDNERNLPPVIMMHGMLDSKKTWKHLAPRIANSTGRKVYAVDARNHGDSPWCKDISFDINTDDLEEFLMSQNIPKVAIVGHSMGGRTAMGLALKRPDIVEKIVVEDMNLKNFEPRQNSMIVYVVEMLREALNKIPPGCDETTAKEAIVDFFTQLIAQLTNKTPKKGKSRYDLSMMPLKRVGNGYAWEANLEAIEEMLTTDKIRQTYKGVFMGDALFLYGGRSVFKVSKDLTIPKFFPNVTMMEFERATHMVHFEYPDRYAEEVSAFINRGGNHSLLKAKY